MSTLINVDTALQVVGVISGVGLSLIRSDEKGTTREAEFRDFFEQEGIRDDITVEDRANLLGIRAIGANLLPRPSISVLPGLYEHDREAYGFLVKKWALVIKSNDLIKIPATLLAVFCAAAFFSKKMDLSFIKHVYLSRCAVSLAAILIIRNRYRKHINFVCEKASNGELLGGLRFLNATIELSKKLGPLAQIFTFFDQKQVLMVEDELRRRKVVIEDVKSPRYQYQLESLIDENSHDYVSKKIKDLKILINFFESFIKKT